MSAAAASVSPCLCRNRLIRLRHNRPQAGRRLRVPRTRNKARISRAAELEMFSPVTGIQRNLRNLGSRKVGRTVIPANSETKILTSITIKTRVTTRKSRRSRPRRLRRRATIGTTAIGIDVIVASS